MCVWQIIYFVVKLNSSHCGKKRSKLINLFSAKAAQFLRSQLKLKRHCRPTNELLCATQPSIYIYILYYATLYYILEYSTVLGCVGATLGERVFPAKFFLKVAPD